MHSPQQRPDPNLNSKPTSPLAAPPYARVSPVSDAHSKSHDSPRSCADGALVKVNANAPVKASLSTNKITSRPTTATISGDSSTTIVAAITPASKADYTPNAARQLLELMQTETVSAGDASSFSEHSITLVLNPCN